MMGVDPDTGKLIGERPGRVAGVSAYDDFVLLKLSDGRTAAGMATYGILRKLI